MTLLPLMGAWHLRYPVYNTVSVLELTVRSQPDALALTPLTPEETRRLDDPQADSAWQDTAEVALPATVVPWAQRQGVALYGVLEPSPDAAAEGDFRRYLSGYDHLRSAVAEVEAHLTPLDTLLPSPLTLARLEGEVLPLLAAHQQAREAAFGDGPGTDWWRARLRVMAERVLALPHKRVTVLASAEHVPLLRELLHPRAELQADPPPEAAASDAVRERALLDVAFRGEVDDPGILIAQLRKLPSAEARFHEANLLLAHGHLLEALGVLETASRGDFSSPYYLPGYLLARLGQLYDLSEKREAAKRAYRGVLALSWVPREAKDAAVAGLETPFEGHLEESATAEVTGRFEQGRV